MSEGEEATPAAGIEDLIESVQRTARLMEQLFADRLKHDRALRMMTCDAALSAGLVALIAGDWLARAAAQPGFDGDIAAGLTRDYGAAVDQLHAELVRLGLREPLTGGSNDE